MHSNSNRAWWQVAVMAVLLPACAQAQERIAVCVHPDAVVNGLTLAQAEQVTARLFTDAGIRITWCHGHPAGDAISIEFSEHTPNGYRPGSMAFARPYEGVHITVFFDRIRARSSAALTPTVLGYVLAHEMTHILQRIDRHSDSGLMKAHWTNADLDQMAAKRLTFSAEDVELIQRGLASQALRASNDQAPAGTL